MPILLRASRLLVRQYGARLTGTAGSSGEARRAAAPLCRRGCPPRPRPGPPRRPPPGPASVPGPKRCATAAGRALERNPGAPPAGEVLPLPLPAAKMAPAASPPLGGGPGVCRNAGGAGDVARPGPLPRPAAARRCPAATRRGPGMLRGEAVRVAGGGRGRGRWWRGAARQRRASPAPRGGREGSRPAFLPGQPLICGRRCCLGPPGRLWSLGVGGVGWGRRLLSVPGRGPGVRGAAVPPRREGNPRYHRRLSPRPQGCGVPSQQPCRSPPPLRPLTAWKKEKVPRKLETVDFSVLGVIMSETNAMRPAAA